jgi:hypothetical protein
MQKNKRPQNEDVKLWLNWALLAVKVVEILLELLKG